MDITTDHDTKDFSTKVVITATSDEILAMWTATDNVVKPVTTVVMVYSDAFVCECRNRSDLDGFAAIDAYGLRLDYQDPNVPYDNQWTGMHECLDCHKWYIFIELGRGVPHLYIQREDGIDRIGYNQIKSSITGEPSRSYFYPVTR